MSEENNWQDLVMERFMKERRMMLNAICSAQVFLEAMDNVKLSDFYQQSIKNAGNKFIKALEPHVNEYANNIFDKDENLAQDILESIEKICSKLAMLNAEDIIIVNKLIDGLKDGSVKFEEQK